MIQTAENARKQHLLIKNTLPSADSIQVELCHTIFSYQILESLAPSNILHHYLNHHYLNHHHHHGERFDQGTEKKFVVIWSSNLVLKGIH